MNRTVQEFADKHMSKIHKYVEDCCMLEEDVVDLIYDDENVYSKAEIQELVEKTVQYLKQDPERCPVCAHLLDDEEVYCDVNECPWGDTVVRELVPCGLACGNCGHEEVF